MPPSIQLNLEVFKAKHFKDLQSILQSQSYFDMGSIVMKTLPKIGYIVYMGKQPVAAGFLRRLEPNLAQIDTLCSCSHFGSNIRHEGIKLVVDTLVDEAKRLKLIGILAFTSDTGIIARAQSIGFHVVEATMIALPLTSQTK